MIKYKPNRYDIVYTKVSKENIPGKVHESEWVSIFDYMTDIDINTIGDLNLSTGHTEVYEGSLCRVSEVIEFRPATEMERIKLFKKMAKEHSLRYDFDKHKYIKVKQEED